MKRRMLEILNDVKKKVPKGRLRVSNPVIVFFSIGCNVVPTYIFSRLYAFIDLSSLPILPILSSVNLHELVRVSEDSTIEFLGSSVA
jgi:hypothetical protein